MIKTIIVILLLYFLFGAILFYTAVKEMGGREMYLTIAFEKNPMDRSPFRDGIVFVTAMLMVTVAWPYFLKKK